MKLLIAGAGGHGRVLADAALATGDYSSVSFLDDRLSGRTDEGWSILGKFSEIEALAPNFHAFAAGVGDAALRIDLLNKARRIGLRCVSIVHPTAFVSRYCMIGDGAVVLSGASVNIGAKIGAACIVNTGATVDHDCELAEGVHVCPGAHLGGNVRIGARTWFGIGAVSRQGITLGADVMVGAGSVVVRDIPDGVRVAGNPARSLAHPVDRHDCSGDSAGEKN